MTTDPARTLITAIVTSDDAAHGDSNDREIDSLREALDLAIEHLPADLRQRIDAAREIADANRES